MKRVWLIVLTMMVLSLTSVSSDFYGENWEMKRLDFYAYKYVFPEFNGYDYCILNTNDSVLFTYFVFEETYPTMYISVFLANMTSSLGMRYLKKVRFDTGIMLYEKNYAFSSSCYLYDDSRLVFVINVMRHDLNWVFEDNVIGVYEIDLKTLNVSKYKVFIVDEPYIANTIFTDNYIVVKLYKFVPWSGNDNIIVIDRRDFTVKGKYSVDYDLLYELLEVEGYTLDIDYASINSVVELNNTLYVFMSVKYTYNYYEFPASEFYYYFSVFVIRIDVMLGQIQPAVVYTLETPPSMNVDAYAVFNERYNKWHILISIESYDVFNLMNHGFGVYGGVQPSDLYYYLVIVDVESDWSNYTDRLFIVDFSVLNWDVVQYYCDSVFVLLDDRYFVYNDLSQRALYSIMNARLVVNDYSPHIDSYTVFNDRLYGLVNDYDDNGYYNYTILFTDSLNGFKLMPLYRSSYLQPSVLNKVNYSIVEYELRRTSVVVDYPYSIVHDISVSDISGQVFVELYGYVLEDSPCCKIIVEEPTTTTTITPSIWFNVSIINNIRAYPLLLLLLYLLFFIPITRTFGVSRALSIASSICCVVALLVGVYDYVSLFLIMMVVGFALWQMGM